MGAGQIEEVKENEVAAIKRVLKSDFVKAVVPEGIKLTFIIVSKRINTRFVLFFVMFCFCFVMNCFCYELFLLWIVVSKRINTGFVLFLCYEFECIKLTFIIVIVVFLWIWRVSKMIYCYNIKYNWGNWDCSNYQNWMPLKYLFLFSCWCIVMIEWMNEWSNDSSKI